MSLLPPLPPPRMPHPCGCGEWPRVMQGSSHGDEPPGWLVWCPGCGLSLGRDEQTDGTYGEFHSQDAAVLAWNSRVPPPDKGREAEALRAAETLIREIMEDKINAQDECEKWLRAYGSAA